MSGRLVVDEAIDLPENAEVEVAILFDDEPDTFDAEERARLDAAITAHANVAGLYTSASRPSLARLS